MTATESPMCPHLPRSPCHLFFSLAVFLRGANLPASVPAHNHTWPRPESVFPGRDPF